MTHRLLHGKQGQDLQQVVLDDVTYDAILVKVAPTPLGAKVFTEDDLQGKGGGQKQAQGVGNVHLIMPYWSK
jgi:hypothetical protein